MWALRDKEAAGEALVVAPSEHAVCLFTIEVTLNQIWETFIISSSPSIALSIYQK
jgi:hypothetical protein